MQIVNTHLHNNSKNNIYGLADYLVFIPSVGNLVFTLVINPKYIRGWYTIVNIYASKGTPLKPGTSYADSFKQETNT